MERKTQKKKQYLAVLPGKCWAIIFMSQNDNLCRPCFQWKTRFASVYRGTVYLLQNRMRNVMFTWARIFYAFLRLFTRSRAVLAAICWSRFVTIATAELCTSATRHRACAPVAPRTPNAIH